MIERIDSIRFERTFDDGTKVFFSVDEPKGLNISNANAIISAGKYGNVGSIPHDWHSVFDCHTKIIVVGRIKEIKLDGLITIYHEGEFDFEELCRGNIKIIGKIKE